VKSEDQLDLQISQIISRLSCCFRLTSFGQLPLAIHTNIYSLVKRHDIPSLGWHEAAQDECGCVHGIMIKCNKLGDSKPVFIPDQ
jgi:hypothetical protein